jgi:hypothetical protein
LGRVQDDDGATARVIEFFAADGVEQLRERLESRSRDTGADRPVDFVGR